MNNTAATSAFAPVFAPAGTPHSLARDMGVSNIVVAKALRRLTLGGTEYSSGLMFSPQSSVRLGTLRLAATQVQAERVAEEAARLAWRAANPEAAAQQDADFLESIAP